MAETDYLEALRLGKKEYKTCVSAGRFPYLPVLDQIIAHEKVQTEKHMGLLQIPLDYVVGTSTMGRTSSFAANFMPILPARSEFGIKWAHLADAHLDEGIRDPIIAYEYRNRYYVVEGNKRVSVLKYFKAVSIPAQVTRKIPYYDAQDEGIRCFYELMDFQEMTGFYDMEFSRVGDVPKFLELIGHTGVWDDGTKEEFKRIYFLFRKAYEFHGGEKLPITLADAFLAFLKVFGYERLGQMSEQEFSTNVLKSWNEFVVLTQHEQVDLVMNPSEHVEKRNLLSYLIPMAVPNPKSKKLTVAFLYPRDPQTSDWIYGHELGRNYLQETFSDQLETFFVSDVNEENIEEVLTESIGRGANIIFEVSPEMMPNSMKVAVDHPEVMILNCSLNTPHRYIRTYYARIYEAKFISGMIAGAMTENDRIGYIADYPIYGMIANINAFALGAACVNPRAKIYLEWSTKKEFNRDDFLWNNQLSFVSDQDMITPQDASRKFGVYRYTEGKLENLAMPLWNWGIFYEKLIQSILAGSYQSERQGSGKKGKALNYWWGMSAGVVDVICSKLVPDGINRLTKHVRADLCTGDMVPFYGKIYSQDGLLRNKESEEMLPEDIMRMDYLVENVIGEIPPIDQLKDAAKSIVSLKGVEEQ